MKKKKLPLKENERKAIISLKKKLSGRFNLVDLRLFGSKARGEDTPESDIDVMIEIAVSTPQIESKIYDLIYDVFPCFFK